MPPPELPSQADLVQELHGRVEVLEQLLRERDTVIARAVIAHLTDEVIIAEVIKRVAAAVESEWTGNFLPGLRASLLRRIEKLEGMETYSD